MTDAFGSNGDRGRAATGAESGAAAAFAAAWNSRSQPPDIAEFLPDAETLRCDVLVELIRIDLRRRWLTGLSRPPAAAPRKRLLDYCAEFPELRPEALPADLVYDEFVIRRHSGERVDPAECLREFPSQASELQQLLTVDDEDRSTRRATADELSSGLDTETGERTRTTADLTAVGTTPGDLDQLEVGRCIDDFDLLTQLGAGAFARVFLARQRTMQRLVAVKISADRGTEPQTLAQLDHDYIVRVFDQRLLLPAAPTAARLRLLYMQFLPGGTLLGVLRKVRATPPARRSGQLLLDAVDAAMEEKGEIRPTDSSVRAEIAACSWPETVAWLGRRLAEALAYADSQGVLHRDVKPANVLLTAEAVPKLADFNISYSRDRDTAGPLAYFGGSLSYMSPEQLEACHPGYDRAAADLDTRSDIYALGVVLWELLTGEKPFDDSKPAADATTGGEVETLSAMLRRRRAGVGAAALAALPADTPAALRRVLLTCLEPDRSQRWPGGAELARQLDLCLDERARDLVDPPLGSWRMRLRRWLVPIVVGAATVPNLVASMFNVQSNRALVMAHLSASAQHDFLLVTFAVNVVFFPLGMITLIYMNRTLLSMTAGPRSDRDYDPRTLARARTDALHFGDRVVVVVFALWATSAIIFPTVLAIATGEVGLRVVVHFLVSLLIYGAMAVAYPFILLSFYLIRCIYPMFVGLGGIEPAEADSLRRLARHGAAMLGAAASVPLLAVAAVTLLPLQDIPTVIVSVRVLSVGAVIAFVVAYVLFRMMEVDLRALERVVDPAAPRRNRGAE
ncbi:serine/threonine-protein kinase [Nocardia stercoris]|uniref:Serine/threonine protein kinase n=1 Tax=Nocardia stercoris TaxID=2483361 RepID=A0A3M2KVY1_9NOCA|nr:serine/threonine-protein kinase [Nocardia stercoris]RMI29361.1 serine/threonine protein kinase [Nocardia stercoris]